VSVKNVGKGALVYNFQDEKLLADIRSVYSEIYDLERKRGEINKKIRVRKVHLFALLNFLRRR
jgi:hypothetical protein